MRWVPTTNPRVWTALGFMAFAAQNPPGAEDGFVGVILKTSYGHDAEEVRGTRKWGGTPDAALRVCVKAFDPEAKLPEEET